MKTGLKTNKTISDFYLNDTTFNEEKNYTGVVSLQPWNYD